MSPDWTVSGIGGIQTLTPFNKITYNDLYMARWIIKSKTNPFVGTSFPELTYGIQTAELHEKSTSQLSQYMYMCRRA